MQDPVVWNNRWQALATTLNEMQAVYKKLPNPTFDAVTTCLKAFGGDQFDFFLTGFNTKRLLPSPEYPPETILRATLDQVGYDITAVQQAVDQRQDGFPTMKDSLAVADAVTQNALNLGIDSGLIKPAAAIVYFIKAPNIRVIPYAPVAIIGVPYTVFTTKRDFLATPHEVGHYIYNQGECVASDLHILLPVMPDWGAGWLEEIFADVYGCLVAGPVIGLDFQDLLADNDLASFITSDGEHPIDAVRPYIYIKVLKELGFENAAKALKKHWQEILKARGNPQSFMPDDEFGEVPMSVAKDFIKETAVAILNYLKERKVPTDQTWTQDLLTPDTDPDELYKAFSTKLDDLAKTPLNTLQIDTNEDKLFVVLPDGEKRNQRQIGDTQTWRDWFKEQSRENSKDKIPKAAWMPVFTALHWPIKGPEANSGGGSP